MKEKAISLTDGSELSIASESHIRKREVLKIQLPKEVSASFLLRFSQDMAAVQSKREFVATMHSYLKQLLSYEDFLVCTLIDGNTRHRTFFYSVSAESNEGYPVEDGFFPIVLRAQQILQFDLEEIHQTGQVVPSYIKNKYQKGINLIVTVPLRARKEEVGVLFLLCKDKNKLDPNVLNLLQAMSYSIAFTVAGILASEEIERREKEKRLLLSFSQAIAAIRSKKDLLEVATQQLREIFLCKDVTMYRIPETFSQNLAHVSSIDSERIVARILESEKPLIFSAHELNAEDNLSEYGQSLVKEGVEGYMAMRLIYGNRTIGVITLLAEKKNIFQEKQYSLMMGVAAQLSIALSNAAANEQIENQLVEIRRYKEQLEKENIYFHEEAVTTCNFSGIIGNSVKMQQVYTLVSQVADSTATVLLLGESGTGKEMIAQAIHTTSSRKEKQMIKVNCAALPLSLIESELFGHEKGSFTGAISRRMGKFEQADQSTIFLDEIGELPPEVQVKLLRVLQEKEIERIGGHSRTKVDIRIIAATNRNLEKEVSEGRFRLDLYYRLNVFPIILPPLRERKEDIPLLAEYFMARYAKKAGKRVAGIAKNVIDSMVLYPWPGNVRELEHMMERTVLLTNDLVIKQIDLPMIMPENTGINTDFTQIKPLQEIEREYILHVVKVCNGRISGPHGAAIRLGLPSTTLLSKMQKLGIRKEHVVEDQR
ncbi:sigma 54-interacting transcriptional regulator [Cytophagaceae bacterium DM2B3-1]|uniref:Sigma 54-interacting transcriptional regulator n=1 Tax=Xanthocytophaga flava TaxID=3048013 RepID=A0ABT7CS34_9BACT|nr:sigma 54-interacting transcriptional regulator [Xanthocytophaga flavus]MDJ1496496.1 sigma 54-interacting transcriptional regulator [Xanthocytophaga flavus]